MVTDGKKEQGDLAKRSYATPVLKVYGKVGQLTAKGGSSATLDSGNSKQTKTA